MNIFLINHYAGSPKMGMEYRPYYLAKEWMKLGHNVTILVANNSHIRQYNPELNSDILEEDIDGINYIWVNTPKYNGNGFGRIKNMFAFIKKTMYKASYFANKYNPDVVIASSTYPSDNYVAKKISKLSGAKYIYEVHDLWPLSPMELGGMSKLHPFIVAMQHAESFAYRKADAVVSMLPKTQEHMKYHGLDLKKWHYIPNGIVLNDWLNPTNLPVKLTEKIKELKVKHKTIIGYTGGHAPSNSLTTLIKAAELLTNENRIHFLFVGDGIEKDNLISQAKNLNNISFFGSIPKLSMPKLLKEIDIAVIGSVKSSLYRFGVSPNKLIDYMMAKKPIIQYIDAGNDILKEANAGISVEPENPKAIVDAINKLLNTPQKELNKMGENGHDFIIKHHDYKVLAKKFIECVNML